MPTPLDRTPDVFTSQTVVVVAEVIPTRCHYQRALSLRRAFPIKLRSFGDWRRGGTRRWKLLADWHDGLDGLTVRLDLLMCRLKEKLKHLRILWKSITQFFAPACTNKIAKGIKNKTTSHALWVKYIRRSLNSTIIYLAREVVLKKEYQWESGMSNPLPSNILAFLSSAVQATDLPLKCIAIAFTWGHGSHHKLTSSK